MEIERKFSLNHFPEHLPLLRGKQCWQGYLYTEPAEVRIRKRVDETTGESDFVLCIKSMGDLVRHEVETDLTEEQFEELRSMLDPEKTLIHKDYRVYDLGNGLELECSIVDDGAFAYAEVEFPDETSALAWQPIPELGPEMTYESGFRMRHYWLDRNARSRA